MNPKGKEIYLKRLKPEDVGESYLAWMNNPEITQFLEARWTQYHMDDLKEFVGKIADSEKDYLFGIFLIADNRHIGNIKIGNIDNRHKFADLGLVIGDNSCWGKGYGTEAVSLATRFGFEQLGLHKIFAGIYANNTGSLKAFLKAGYREAGLLKEHRIFKGSYVDEILVEIIRDH